MYKGKKPPFRIQRLLHRYFQHDCSDGVKVTEYSSQERGESKPGNSLDYLQTNFCNVFEYQGSLQPECYVCNTEPR